MANSLPHNLKNLCHSQITTAHRLLSIYVLEKWKNVCPCKVLKKWMPEIIDSSSKNDMYIMDFPTAHRLPHKKTTAAQVTTLTLYIMTGGHRPAVSKAPQSFKCSPVKGILPASASWQRAHKK